jgi:hypothetical protein
MNTAPQPKEKKPLPSLLEGSVLVPGAVIAAGLLVIATGYGLVKLFSDRRRKERTKATKLDE